MGRADKRDAREDARAIRADAFRPKFEAEMGARGRVRTTLSVWIVLLGRVLCPCGRVRTAFVRLGRPAGDALSHEVSRACREKSRIRNVLE
jgi:hypothetical protein